MRRPYRGRFAPSPTGALHQGSLFTACISYLEATARQGEWLIRIEDLDPPREESGASDNILACLRAHKLNPSLPVVYQSKRSHLYETALQKLYQQGRVYQCPCSRNELKQAPAHLPECGRHQLDGSYDGDKSDVALRFRGQGLRFEWVDEVQGLQVLEIPEDFVLKRKEGLYAYQLAVVVDDIDQGITHIVRGIDLLDSTPMQLALYQAFDQPPPSFAHLPILIDENKQKLSKQNKASPVMGAHAIANLSYMMALAGFPYCNKLGTCEAILDTVRNTWQLNALLNKQTIDAIKT